MRASKILLFICNDSLQAYGWRGSQLQSLGLFPASAEGRAALGELARTHTRIPFYALLDVVEEDFHTDTIPHVRGKDRAALLVRKLQQQFRGSQYVNAWVQGRESAGRRDDRVLLSGLLNGDVVDAWFDVLAQHQVPLASVCSMSLLSASIVKRFRPDAEHVLLVTEDAQSGIRQSYFRHGELKFSRLTAAAGVQDDDLGEKITSECRRTRQYLASLRLVNRDDRLATLLVCSAKAQPQLERDCRSGEGVDFCFASLEDVAKAFRIKHAADISVAELMLQLIGWRSWRNHYAPAARRRHFWLWLAGRWLGRASALVLLLAGSVASWQASLAMETDVQTQALHGRMAQAERLKQSSALPVSDLPPPAIMKQAVERIDATQRSWPSFPDRLIRLAQLYQRYPLLTIETLQWGVSPNEMLLDPGGSSKPAGPQPAADVVVAGEPQIQGQGGEASSQPSLIDLKRFEITKLAGKVNPFTDNYRAAVDSVAHFVRDWQQADRATVNQVKLPLDTRPDQTLEVLAPASDDARDRTDYELEMVRPLSGVGK